MVIVLDLPSDMTEEVKQSIANLPEDSRKFIKEITTGHYDMPGIGKVKIMIDKEGKLVVENNPNLSIAEVMWEGKKL